VSQCLKQSFIFIIEKKFKSMLITKASLSLSSFNKSVFIVGSLIISYSARTIRKIESGAQNVLYCNILFGYIYFIDNMKMEFLKLLDTHLLTNLASFSPQSIYFITIPLAFSSVTILGVSPISLSISIKQVLFPVLNCIVDLFIIIVLISMMPFILYGFWNCLVCVLYT